MFLEDDYHKKDQKTAEGIKNRLKQMTDKEEDKFGPKLTSTKQKVAKLLKKRKPETEEIPDQEEENLGSSGSDAESASPENGKIVKAKPGQQATSSGTKTWSDLELSKPLLKAIEDLGYEHPTLVQEMTIPSIITGRDVLASSITGSGKTAAF